MHLGKSYRVSEVIVWTRRQIYLLLAIGVIPVVLYQVLGARWLSMPLTMVGLLGTATSFIVGFKNVQTYNRTVEAQQLWTSILSSSRFWGLSAKNFVTRPTDARELVTRHLAWLTCLRYELRSPRPWETMNTASGVAYRTHYRVPELEVPLRDELIKHLSPTEHALISDVESKATQVLWLQGRALKRILKEDGVLPTFYLELNRLQKEFIEQQGRAERIKNVPYPRQYAVINTIFVWAFSALLPFGLLQEFDKLNEGITGLLQGSMVWLVIPFSATISWMYVALVQVGESTENPFEGGANDVPISMISKLVEQELMELIGEAEPSVLPQSTNDIVL